MNNELFDKLIVAAASGFAIPRSQVSLDLDAKVKYDAERVVIFAAAILEARENYLAAREGTL